MKKIILTSILFIYFFTSQGNAQRIMSPQLVSYFGIGNIFYPNGFYQGEIYNGVAHGTGTYYFSDGTIYRGHFYDGWRDGPGVIIAPYEGYLTTCWDMGNFVGPECDTFQESPSYNSNQIVKEVVQEIYDDFPDEAEFAANTPDNYEIIQIKSNTKLGKTLLGKYSGK